MHRPSNDIYSLLVVGVTAALVGFGMVYFSAKLERDRQKRHAETETAASESRPPDFFFALIPFRKAGTDMAGAFVCERLSLE
jgi:hypothetical protein